MAELSTEVIDIIEEMDLDEDLRQDLYIHWLESEKPKQDFVSTIHLKAFVYAFYGNLLKNKKAVGNNRKRILVENEDSIRRNTSMQGNTEDPLDLLITEEEMKVRFQDLSPLLRDTIEAIAIHGRTPEELAEAEGTSANAVYQRIFNAKKALRGETDGKE